MAQAPDDEPPRSLDEFARLLYEDGRRYVEGRPAWEDLDPQDPYDAGMKEAAYRLARAMMTGL